MSLTRPKPSRFQRYLAHEQHRLEKMSWQTLGLLLAVTLALILFNPLLPPLAYILQLWAANWAWRDRWASLRVLTKQGLTFVGALYLLATLDLAHLWIIPNLIAPLQIFWSTHLPGELSLVPIFPEDLLARCLLLLPLAPAVTTLYEYINPQANQRLHRVLQASDLANATTPTASAPLSQPTLPMRKKQEKPGQRSTPPLHRKMPPPEQMTIDSFISKVEPAQPAPPLQQTQPATTPPNNPTKPATTRTPRPMQKQEKEIDWRNIDE
jgi:hypothetical protein